MKPAGKTDAIEYGCPPLALKTLRLALGLTQEELAEIIGVDQGTVYRYEQPDAPEDATLRLSQLARLCTATQREPSRVVEILIQPKPR